MPFYDNYKKSISSSLIDISLGISILTINNLNIFNKTNLPIIPTTTVNPITDLPTITQMSIKTSSTIYPPTTPSIISTTINPIPPLLSLPYEAEKSLTTYVSNNIYGISLICCGFSEFFRGRFNRFKTITNVINGICLTATGINMMCANIITKNDTLIPIVAGIKQIKDKIYEYQPINEELQMEEPFNSETARLINASNYDNISNTSDVIYDRSNPYQPTTYQI